MVQIARSVVGALVGLFLISILVESLEFSLIALINGQPTTDPDTYYSIRNQLWFLGLKLVYNTLAAIIGGFVAAVIAGFGYLKHGIALALLQTISFGLALTQPEMSRWTPTWMWIALMLLSFGGTILGAYIQAHRQTEDPTLELELAA